MKPGLRYGLVAAAAVIVLVLEFTLTPRPLTSLPLGALEIAAGSVAAVRIARRWRLGITSRGAFVIEALAVLLLLLFIYSKGRLLVEIALIGDPSPNLRHPSGLYAAGLGFAWLVALASRSQPARALAGAVVGSPARLMVLTFVGAMLGGTVLLALPMAVVDLDRVSLVDSLFTATSAVCVTGLAVNDVGATYTSFGHLVILVLVQIGGLGIMTLGTTAYAFASRSLRVRDSASMAEILDVDSLAAMRRLVQRIVITAAVLETSGALALYFLFDPEHPISGSRAFDAVFHAVSAFCNAGFSLYPDSLTRYAEAPGVNAVMITLIVIGGIGFPVIDDLTRAAWERMRTGPRRRVSLHTRLVLWTTGGLVLFGAVGFLVLEWSASLAHLPASSRPLAALFQSVTTRTAGFNTVDFGAATPATLLFVMGLMFVGGSPASTAGGIKTTTFVVFLISLRSLVRGRARTEIRDRTLPEVVLSRALAVLAGSALVVLVGSFLLLLVERQEPLRVLFEACSAFGTAGLSTGITGELHILGKLILVILMLAGRVGPLTLALALADSVAKRPVTFPEERVLIG